ncbi:MFS transporter [Streptomyces capparidis]
MSLLTPFRVDLAPLRGQAFRRLFLARTVTRFGSAATATAMLFHIATLTDSPLATGLVAGVQLVPVLVLGLYGGHLADRYDRRRVALGAEAALLVLSVVLVLTALSSRPSLPLMYIVVAGSAALSSMQRAALDAAVPRVVDRPHLPAASAWLSMASTTAGVAGPVVGAVLFHAWGPAPTYLLDSVSFAVSVLLLWGLPPLPPDRSGESPSVLRSLGEGIAYVGGRPDLRASYLFDLAAMGLAAPTTLLPFLAPSIGADASAGILFAAAAVGSLVMGSLSGWTGRLTRIGTPLALACGVYGATTAALSVSPSLAVAVLVLALGGAADCLSVIFRDTLWNATIPDHLRGRVAGVEVVSYAVGAPVGGLVLGALAAWWGVRPALAVGGLGCVVAILAVALFMPEVRRVTVTEGPAESPAPSSPEA